MKSAKSIKSTIPPSSQPFDEFRKIYKLPIEKETVIKKGGSWPAYDYAIQELEENYETVEVCD